MSDRRTVEEMRNHVNRIDQEATALQELGDREGFPAVERNATRLLGVIDQLKHALPPELLEE